VACDTFQVITFAIFKQIRFSKFPKVVQRHILGVVKISTRDLLQLSFSFQQRKNFQDWLRFDKVTGKIKVAPFYGLWCIKFNMDTYLLTYYLLTC